MLKLRSLLSENPDLTLYKGDAYDYGSQEVVGVFSIFQDQETRRWVGACSNFLSRHRISIITTDPDLNQLLKDEDVDMLHDVYPIHPGLLSVFEKLRKVRSFKNYEYRGSRPDAPIHGRVWHTVTLRRPVYLVSLWCDSKTFMRYIRYVEDTLKLMHVDITKSSFEFINQPNQWHSYQEVVSGESEQGKKASTELVNKLLQIQHINPIAKSVLKNIRGVPNDALQTLADKLNTTVAALKAATSMDEQRIVESPDAIIAAKNKYLDWRSNAHFVTFSIIKTEGGGYHWYGYRLDDGKFFVDGKDSGRPADEMYETGKPITHSYMELYFLNTVRDDTDSMTYAGEQERIVNGRIFKYEGIFYVCFWETADDIKEHFQRIRELIDVFTDGALDKVQIQFVDMQGDEFVPYADVFQADKKLPKGTVSSEEIDILKKLHLMAPEEKSRLLKKINAMQPNQLQRMADSLGISVAQLKQSLGRDVAETTLLKESPDFIYIDNVKYGYYTECAIGLFTIYRHRDGDYYIAHSDRNNFYVNGDLILSDEGIDTHADMKAPWRNYVFDSKSITLDEFNKISSGRIFEVKNKHYMCFWEYDIAIKPRRKEIERVCEYFQISIDDNLFVQMGNWGLDQFVKFDSFFEGEKAEKTITDDELETLKQLHLLDPEKKAQALRKLHAAKNNDIERIADKMGMPPIKLKQLLGRDIAENRRPLHESPDEIEVGGKSYFIGDDSVLGMFACGYFQNEGELTVVYTDDDHSFVYENGKKVVSFSGSTHYDMMTDWLSAKLNLKWNHWNMIIKQYWSRVANGRVYEVDGKYYIPFWEKSDTLKKHKELFEKVMKIYNIPSEKLFIQPAELSNEKFIRYLDFFDSKVTSTRSDAEIELLKQLHLLPPTKKAEFLKRLNAMKADKLKVVADKLGMSAIELKQLLGRDVAEASLLKEDPDEIVVDGEGFDYTDTQVFCIFSYGYSKTDKSTPLLIACDFKKIYVNGKPIMKADSDTNTHTEMLDAWADKSFFVLDDNGNYPKIDQYENFSDKYWRRKIHARVYKVYKNFYISAWESVAIMRKYKEAFIDICKQFKIPFDRVYIQSAYMFDDKKFIHFADFFKNKKIATKSRAEVELLRQLHLMDPAKKAEILKRLNAMKADKLKAVADKLGITSIELKRLLGRDVAENSLGNLSFSDYHTPDIPYEAKP